MRAILVDDERLILQDLKETIQQYTGVEVVATYLSPLEALENIRITKPECAFLDIEMPGMSGIDLAEKLLEINPEMDIVFITAFNHFATQAFEINAMDYVLKPINPVRFEKTMEKLMNHNKNEMEITPREVHIQSLGNFDVFIDNKAIKWSRSKARELLAYLLHNEGSKKSKYVICEELWPDYEPKKGLAHLQTAICSLRKSLGIIGQNHIQIQFSEDRYGLSLDNVDWDLRKFEQLFETVRAGQDDNQFACAEKAIALYKGEYMGSEDWPWSQFMAESLARKYELLLKIIAEHNYKNGYFIQCVESVLLLAERKNLDEKLQILFAEAAYANGGSAGLNQQISLLRKIYKKEQGMELDQILFDYCRYKGVIID